MTVAVSNMATGALGCGYTGSYIFRWAAAPSLLFGGGCGGRFSRSQDVPACSQTIFTMRAGVFSRVNGWVVALSEYVMFALPFPGGRARLARSAANPTAGLPT
jgi:SulP family sulfate permease